MIPQSRYAILVDGGFIIKKLEKSLGRFPSADEIETHCLNITKHPELARLDLLRIYFYHAQPAKDVLSNPVDGTSINLASSPIFAKHESLLDKLELKPNFAVRLGETVAHGWRLGSAALKNLPKSQRPIQAADLVPNISQKGVDLRIGLDIARLSLREMVAVIVVVTGDSDLVPAFRFARREGVRIFLDFMGHGVRRELKAHADIVL